MDALIYTNNNFYQIVFKTIAATRFELALWDESSHVKLLDVSDIHKKQNFKSMM